MPRLEVPDVVNDSSKSVLAEPPGWMYLPNNRPGYVFDSREGCCEGRACTEGYVSPSDAPTATSATAVTTASATTSAAATATSSTDTGTTSSTTSDGAAASTTTTTDDAASTDSPTAMPMTGATKMI